MTAARYTLGMLGPILVEEFREFLDPRTLPSAVPPGIGGSPVNLLCRELLRRGHRLVVFTLDPRVTDEVVLAGERLRICIGPYGARPARTFFRTARRYLEAAMQRERPDVLHAQWTYEFALAALATGLPHVVTAHDAPLNVVRLNFIPYRIARTLMAYAALWRARRVVAVSPYVAAHLRRCGFHRGHIDVIANGLSAAAHEAPAARRHDARAPCFATVLVGWTRYKNAPAALAAFALVRRFFPAARLLMFGAGHGPGEQAERYARARRLGGGVEFVGHVTAGALRRRLAEEVDVLVHPALEEAQPMTLIEAMALGIPVIGGEASGGVPWTLDDGKAGVLVDVRRPTALAAAMIDLATDAQARAAFGAAGRELAVRRHYIGAVADAYERIYAELHQERDIRAAAVAARLG